MRVIFTGRIDLDKFEVDGIINLPFSSINASKSKLSVLIDNEPHEFDVFYNNNSASIDMRQFNKKVESINLKKHSDGFYEIVSVCVIEEIEEIDEPSSPPTEKTEPKQTKGGCPNKSAGSSYIKRKMNI